MTKHYMRAMLVLALLPQLTGCTDDSTLPRAGDSTPTFALSNPGVTGTRTSTGFFYPTGTTDFGDNCGGWMGRSYPNGCYTSGYYHIGVDMQRGLDQPVYAISAGTVDRVSLNGWGTGNVALLIKHTRSDGAQFVALYGHIKTQLQVGDRVSGGVEIGTIGSWLSYDHLHFGLLPPNVPIPSTNLGLMPNSAWSGTNGFVDPVGWINNNAPKCQNGTAEKYRPGGNLPVHPNGSLVQAPGDGTVYVLQGGMKRGITSPQVLWELYGPGRGFGFQDVITISPEELGSYPRGADVSGYLPGNGRSQPDGRLIQQAGSYEISIVSDNGVRKPFSSLSAFLALGYTFCNVATVSDYYSYPVGSLISR